MKTFRDFFYDKNDILVAVLIVALADSREHSFSGKYRCRKDLFVQQYREGTYSDRKSVV